MLHQILTIANEYVLYRKYDQSNPPLFYCKTCSFITARPMELCRHIVKCKKSNNTYNSNNYNVIINGKKSSKLRFSKSSKFSRNNNHESYNNNVVLNNNKLVETDAIIQTVLNRIEENN